MWIDIVSAPVDIFAWTQIWRWPPQMQIPKVSMWLASLIFVLWCNVRQHSLDNNVDSQLLSNNRYLLRVVFVHLGRIKRCLIFYRARNEIIIRAGSVGAGLQRGGRGGGGLLHLAQCNTHWPPNIYIISTCTWNLTRGRAGKGSSRSLKFHNQAEGPF